MFTAFTSATTSFANPTHANPKKEMLALRAWIETIIGE
jgi:hypothetical protein